MDKDNLENEIKIELENIERLLNEAKGLLEKANNEPGFIETRAAGSILHDFYCGIEKIFEETPTWQWLLENCSNNAISWRL